MNDTAPKAPLDAAGAPPSKHPTDPADRILNGLGDAPPPMRNASESHGENSASFYGDPKPVIDRQPAPPQEEAVIISNAPDPSRVAETEVTIRKRKPGADDTGAHARSMMWVAAMFVVIAAASAAILWSLGHRRQPEVQVITPTVAPLPDPVPAATTPTPTPLPTNNVAPTEPVAASPSAPQKRLPAPIKPKKRDIAPGL